jgi:hypothetical protein
VKAEVTHILYHIQESRPYLEGLLRGGSGELFMAELRRRVAKELAGQLSAGIEGVPADYLSNHVACDFTETVRWWMRNPQYPPEEICRFFLATTRL